MIEIKKTEKRKKKGRRKLKETGEKKWGKGVKKIGERNYLKEEKEG